MGRGIVTWSTPQVADNDSERIKKANLAIREVGGAAKPLDKIMRTAKIWPWHRRKKMVFDLIVETAEHKGKNGTTGDVSRRDHLTVNEGQL